GESRDGADVAGGGPAQAGGDRQAAKPGAEGVGQVESGVVGGGGKGLRAGRHIHQMGLQYRPESDHGADGKDGRHQAPQGVRGEGKQQQYQRAPRQYPAGGLEAQPVEQPAAGKIADDAAQAKDGQSNGNPVLVGASHFQQ